MAKFNADHSSSTLTGAARVNTDALSTKMAELTEGLLKGEYTKTSELVEAVMDKLDAGDLAYWATRKVMETADKFVLDRVSKGLEESSEESPLKDALADVIRQLGNKK